MEKFKREFKYGDGTTIEKIQINADEGKILTNGKEETYCVFCLNEEETEKWYEIDDKENINE